MTEKKGTTNVKKEAHAVSEQVWEKKKKKKKLTKWYLLCYLLLIVYLLVCAGGQGPGFDDGTVRAGQRRGCRG